MQAGPRRPFAWSRLPLAVLAAVVVFAGLILTAVPPVLAQEARPWSLRDLFMPRRERAAPPENTVPGKPAKPARAKPKKNPAVQRVVEPEVVVEAKAPDAKVVLVLGDFVGSGLAEGLNAVFATNPGVRIADRTNGASGFVREDHFDWPGQVAGMIAAERPTVVVALFGANDRQQMRIGNARETLRSEAWNREYTARAASFASVVSVDDIPFVWVGTPPFRSAKSSTDMLAFNEIYRKVAADVGAEFIDVWEGFVDENGTFVTTGPDIAGQPVKLRAGDGINFTQAGKRKLAFYTEKPLRRLLGEAGTPASGTGGVPAIGPVAPGAPADRTAPIALDDPELDGGAELLGASVTPKPAAQPAADDDAATAAAGRADDFSWPRGSNASVSTSVDHDIETVSTGTSRPTSAPAAN